MVGEQITQKGRHGCGGLFVAVAVLGAAWVRFPMSPGLYAPIVKARQNAFKQLTEDNKKAGTICPGFKCSICVINFLYRGRFRSVPL